LKMKNEKKVKKKTYFVFVSKNKNKKERKVYLDFSVLIFFKRFKLETTFKFIFSSSSKIGEKRSRARKKIGFF
jgi:hypothetical protein